MDEFVQTLITGAPNLIVALWVIFWQSRRIERMESLLFTLVAECYNLPEGDENRDDGGS